MDTRRKKMKQQRAQWIGLLGAVTLLAGEGGPLFAQTAQTVSIPAQTIVRVQLMRDISSQTMEVGDRVSVRVAPDDASGLPKNAVFTGRVTEVMSATKTAPGVVDVHFGALQLGSVWQGISADLTTNGEPFVDETANLSATGKAQTEFNRKLIGYGAGAGAVLGALSRHNSRAFVTGGLLGGAAGLLTARAHRKQVYKDVNLKAGTEFSLVLNRPLSVRTTITAR
jgi:hypothetical protein